MQTSKIATIVAAVVASCVPLLGQAAAEGALTHALSSAATSTAGSAMGRAANQLAGKLGQRVSSAASTPQVSAMKKVPRKAPPAQAAPAASVFGGSLITSIQGGKAMDTGCTSTGSSSQIPAAKPEKPNMEVQNGCSDTKSTGTDDHPAVINLPPAK